MITEQVVTYIKDQLSRGTPRDKIRSNLTSAGWVPSDIDEAFSFAEPRGENQTIKIAPAFAVQDEIVIEKPVDKTKLVNNSQDMMPILKKDEPTSVVNTTVNINPAPALEIKPEPALQSQPAVSNMAASNIMPKLSLESQEKKPVFMDPLPKKETNEISPDSISLGFEKPKSSGLLKLIAFLLFMVLILGNLYVWVLSGNPSNKDFQNLNNSQIDSPKIQEQTQRDSSTVNVPNQNIDISPADNLKPATAALQKAATIYFSANNSYGSKDMALGSCSVSSTVFSNQDVKMALNELASISKAIPQCALFADKAGNTSRTISYIVYVPMGDAGYCIDSSGASIVVPSKPIGSTCTEGL